LDQVDQTSKVEVVDYLPRHSPFFQLAEQSKPEASEGLSVAVKQIASADIVLINKLDLISNNQKVCLSQIPRSI